MFDIESVHGKGTNYSRIRKSLKNESRSALGVELIVGSFQSYQEPCSLRRTYGELFRSDLRVLQAFLEEQGQLGIPGLHRFNLDLQLFQLFRCHFHTNRFEEGIQEAKEGYTRRVSVSCVANFRGANFIAFFACGCNRCASSP